MKNKCINGMLSTILFICGISLTSQAQTVVSITDYGAVGNGTTDNLPALNRAIADAQNRGLTLSVPAGTFAYRGVIKINGIKLVGSGHSSVLYALDYNNESIFMYGNGTEVRNLKLTGVKSPNRLAPWEATHITLFGTTNFVIDNVYIEGSAAAGIQTADGANHGSITNNIVRNTLSDSIHMTGGANFITVENNLIENSGDDGIAVVSYNSDGVAVHDITARNNRVLNNVWGRNMSVVGGSNILYENNYLEGNPNVACMYLAQEFPAGQSMYTFGDRNVTAQYNTLKNCGSTQTGHAAIMMFTDGADYNDNMKLIRNDIVQSGLGGIRIYGDNRRVLLDSNRVTGANPDYSISTTGVTLIRYSSGSVGYTAPTAPSPAPAPAPAPAPSYTLSVESPTSNQIVKGILTVSGKASGFLNVEIFNSAGSMLARATPAADTRYTASVDTTKLAEGVQDLVVHAWDSAPGAAFSHEAEQRVSINVQNTVVPATQPITVLQSSPSSSTVYRGRTFNLTYRFSGGPSEQNMTVFVHFINSSGQIVFGDDHIPAKATTTWSGSYSYTRQIAVPSGIAKGSYKIVVGLYDPVTGLRMSLTGGSGVIVLSDMRYQVGTVSVR